ncbi:MAG: acyclic terpene utilization AtuA family protein, partial [Proteobacteria bacterium]|nr:acyclic terpene utilization AtuA family protein [Pseudomonadota bacterium]
MSAPLVRIGTGAGFAADRLDPALDLVRRGKLDVLVLECLGERTVAFAHRDRMANPARGYNRLLDHRMRALLRPCRDAGTTMITNMGAANPRAGAERTVEIARGL